MTLGFWRRQAPPESQGHPDTRASHVHQAPENGGNGERV